MTHQELMENIASDINFPQSEVEILMRMFTDAVSDTLNNEETVNFLNFGTFYVEKREEKISFDEETKTKTLVPPSLIVKYKESEVLKQKINLKS